MEKKPNRLIKETSPYLQQHAYNPVEWYPWGEEAISKAKAENKPILLSIGYSSCHWCHVMEHESFEDPETAELMNSNFINIKLDKEERPDLDQIYMGFVQMTTGSGGWPLNVFLTPGLVPFYGGTYFPPSDRHRMPSWRRILASVSDAFKNDLEGINNSAQEILGELKKAGTFTHSTDGLSSENLDSAFNALARSFDHTNGGFGGQPKFPPSMALEFLLAYHKSTGNALALEIASKTLYKMGNGGIYDQLGGGFHRYTVDANWLTPHFEKMLYDNSQLALLYLHAFQLTKEARYLEIACETLDYVLREMTNEDGGFYSAQDADSEGVEGKFFVWDKAEVIEILGEEDGGAFCYYFDISEHGNFEEKNILNVRKRLESASEALGIPPGKLSGIIQDGRKKLFAVREKRIKPFRDEKVIAAWNGLMLKAFAEASAIAASPGYLAAAKRNADFLIGNLLIEGNLHRTWKDGEAKIPGFLDDHSNLADGLLALYQVSGEIKYLNTARELADSLITSFWDEEAGGFFLSSPGHDGLILRPKDFFDNAEPSGNSVAIEVFLKLSLLLGDDKYEKFAVSLLRLVHSQAMRYPNAFGRSLWGLWFYLSRKKEVVIIGPRGNNLEKAVWEGFLPEKIVVLAEDSSNIGNLPLLKGRGVIEGGPTAYVCENYTCLSPANSESEFKRQLK